MKLTTKFFEICNKHGLLSKFAKYYDINSYNKTTQKVNYRISFYSSHCNKERIEAVSKELAEIYPSSFKLKFISSSYGNRLINKVVLNISLPVPATVIAASAIWCRIFFRNKYNISATGQFTHVLTLGYTEHVTHSVKEKCTLDLSNAIAKIIAAGYVQDGNTFSKTTQL